MALTPDQYKQGGISDVSDFMDRGRDDAWPDDQIWDLDGQKVTEREFQEALAEYQRTGKRPDWATK